MEDMKTRFFFKEVKFEPAYEEIREFLYPLLPVEQLLFVENCKAARTIITAAYHKNRLGVIEKTLTSKNVTFAKEDEKGDAFLYQIRKNMPGYLKPEYIAARKRVVEILGFEMCNILETSKCFQEIAAKVFLHPNFKEFLQEVARISDKGGFEYLMCILADYLTTIILYDLQVIVEVLRVWYEGSNIFNWLGIINVPSASNEELLEVIDFLDGTFDKDLPKGKIENDLWEQNADIFNKVFLFIKTCKIVFEEQEGYPEAHLDNVPHFISKNFSSDEFLVFIQPFKFEWEFKKIAAEIFKLSSRVSYNEDDFQYFLGAILV